MKLDLSFIKRKVARRIFVQFVLCALVPILAVAVVSFFQVRSELERQGQNRLHEATRSLGLSVYDRLGNVENDLKVLSLELRPRAGDRVREIGQKYVEHLRRPFKSLALVAENGKAASFLGAIPPLPEQTDSQRQHLSSGMGLVFVSYEKDGSNHIGMMRLIDAQNPDRGLLVGEINSKYLWGLDEDNTLPAMTELSVMDGEGRVFFSTIPVSAEFVKRPEFKRSRSAVSSFEWAYEGEAYAAAFWTVFMKYHWHYPKLTVVMSTPKFHIFAPITFFKKIFPLIVLLSLWVVLLLSAIQIRRTTQPLKALSEGTRRIAKQDFNSRVVVSSGDEFEELGDSFNEMALQLGRQFNTLATIGAIERAILSSVETESLVDTVITRVKSVLNYDVASVSLIDSRQQNIARTYVRGLKEELERFTEKTTLSPLEVKTLGENSEYYLFEDQADVPSYLVPMAAGGARYFAVFPLFIKQALAGLIALGRWTSRPYGPEDLRQGRQIANQVAVALSNVRLIEELDLLNWGTLTALARTVDAKSPWTAGHSERVTQTAVALGRALGLPDDRLQNLHRAALLHDIGKIATPVSILDKAGTLTDEERKIAQAHAEIGGRILEPISAYASAIPIVVQHHEHYDGKGYPGGLAGADICLGGRILALADFYDALISDRPYRAGIEPARVIEIIRQEAGKHFDPEIAQSFIALMEGKAGHKAESEEKIERASAAV